MHSNVVTLNLIQLSNIDEKWFALSYFKEKRYINIYFYYYIMLSVLRPKQYLQKQLA